MPIVQGKTNWKFLAIVIILAIIIGGFFAWRNWGRWFAPIYLDGFNGSYFCHNGKLALYEPFNTNLFYYGERNAICMDCGEVGAYICGDKFWVRFFNGLSKWKTPLEGPYNINQLQEFKVKHETAPWQTYKNEELSFEMKYPEKLVSEEILLPRAFTVQCDYANFTNKCPFIPIEGFVGTQEDIIKQGIATTTRLNINGVSFCQQKRSGGALGTTYTTYSYVTARNNKCIAVSFTVPYPNCQNYLPVKEPWMQASYDECIKDNEIEMPQVIDLMLSTFKFLSN
jgi:hypothetical protein